MKRDEKQKKEIDWEERWHAKMNAIEALWQTRMEESRSDYLETYIQVNKKRSETNRLQ